MNNFITRRSAAFRGAARASAGLTSVAAALLFSTQLSFAASAGPQFSQQGGNIVPTVHTGNSAFGAAVAMSGDGNYAVIGGPQDNTFAGALWFISRDSGTGNWSTPNGKMVPSDGGTFHLNGYSAAMNSDGSIALVGSAGADAFWAYTRSGANWSQFGTKITQADLPGQGFGQVIAMSADGNTALIGAPSATYNSIGGTQNWGAAWVFTRDGMTGIWSEQAYLNPSFTPATAQFGSSLALSADGNTALIGVSGANCGPCVGYAQIFTRSGGVWSSKQVLSPSISNSAFAGTAVAMNSDGQVMFVGSPGESKIYIYSYNSGTDTWDLNTTLTESDPGYGYAIAASSTGQTLVALAGDTSTGLLFTHLGPDWPSSTFQATDTGTLGVTGNYAGFLGLSADGNSMIIGTGTYNALGSARAFSQALSIEVINPTIGTTPGGDSITVYGRGFGGTTGVSFGANAGTSVTVLDPHTIQVSTPAGAEGTVDVSVTNRIASATLSGAYTYYPVTQITDFTAAGSTFSTHDGPVAGGQTVVITGSGLNAVTAVKFGGVDATTFVIDNSGQITATTPAQTAGAVNLTVTTPIGDVTAASQFTFLDLPIINNIAPNVGPLGGGTSVTIIGASFNTTTGVKFGADTAAFTIDSDTVITATAPAHAAGSVSIQVVTDGGSNTVSGAFTYFRRPAVASISPTAGPSAGGTNMTITGTNFNMVSDVTIGGVSVPRNVLNSTTIILTTPAHAASIAYVLVTTPGGTSPQTINGQFRYQDPPTVSSVAPNAGPSAGGTSTVIRGTNFFNVSAVTIGGVAAASFTVNSSTMITATTPAHAAGAADIAITTPGGTSSVVAADVFTFDDIPTITSLSPNKGPLTGGTSVTITGTNLDSATKVTFGNSIATFTVNSATSISATAPAHSAGLLNVRVTTPGGVTANSTGSQFYYDAVPAITSVSPVNGPAAGGANVVINGADLMHTTGVSFGGTPAASFVVNNNTKVTAVSPAHSTGQIDIQVTTPGGTSATGAGDLYTFFPAPTVTNVTPAVGPSAGGTAVTITGTGFAGATSVMFGSVAAATFSVDTPTSISATTPAHGAGTSAVKVTTPGGAGVRTNGFKFYDVPVITALSPNNDYIAGGTVITIVGTSLAGVTSVTIDGQPVAIQSSAMSRIKVTAPAHSAGLVDVVVTTPGGASTAAQFNYRTPPTAQAIYQFKGGHTDGSDPAGWLVADGGGNLYGVTTSGGASGLGTVFRLNNPGNNDPWTETILYSFKSGPNSGSAPAGGVFLHTDGKLYGMTPSGGAHSYGIVYRLSEQANPALPWTLEVLYSLEESTLGTSGVVVDASGTVYGATGSFDAPGSIFTLTPQASAPWPATALHNFTDSPDGAAPIGRLALDGLYLRGSTVFGGVNGNGMVYRIKRTGGPSAPAILYSFGGVANDGALPYLGGVAADSAGNLYGTTNSGGTVDLGTVFKLAARALPTTALTEQKLVDFDGIIGANPTYGLAAAPNDSLYGVVDTGAPAGDLLYNLIPPAAGAVDWTRRSVHSFIYADPTGRVLNSDPLINGGVIYGLTSAGGGACGCGAVYAIKGELGP